MERWLLAAPGDENQGAGADGASDFRLHIDICGVSVKRSKLNASYGTGWAMQLTRFTDYTLRVLIAVGVSREGGITIGDISQRYGISKNHLMKVVQHLGRSGYLETVRGRGGGLSLALAAEDINIGRLVREVEGGFPIVPCFEGGRKPACVIAPACVLRGVLGQALEAFLAVLDACTLADLLGPQNELRKLLAADST
jgi:Rrf2 family nitric oxide-sensitive transcriptional repressor